MDHPVFIEFPDAQIEGAKVWVKSDSVIMVLPSPTEGCCTLMVSSNLDAGIEVSMSPQSAVEKINEAIKGASSNGYYLPIDKRMYNAEAT